MYVFVIHEVYNCRVSESCSAHTHMYLCMYWGICGIFVVIVCTFCLILDLSSLSRCACQSLEGKPLQIVSVRLRLYSLHLNYIELYSTRFSIYSLHFHSLDSSSYNFFYSLQLIAAWLNSLPFFLTNCVSLELLPVQHNTTSTRSTRYNLLSLDVHSLQVTIIRIALRFDKAISLLPRTTSFHSHFRSLSHT